MNQAFDKNILVQKLYTEEEIEQYKHKNVPITLQLIFTQSEQEFNDRCAKRLDLVEAAFLKGCREMYLLDQEHINEQADLIQGLCKWMQIMYDHFAAAGAECGTQQKVLDRTKAILKQCKEEGILLAVPASSVDGADAGVDANTNVTEDIQGEEDARLSDLDPDVNALYLEVSTSSTAIEIIDNYVSSS
jgi:imidazolonepropionase-like amidohydrolase